MPDYIREPKLILLSKTRSSEASLDEARLIAFAKHLTKIVEKAIEYKIGKIRSKLLSTAYY